MTIGQERRAGLNAVRKFGLGNSDRDWVAYNNFQAVPAAAIAAGNNQDVRFIGTGTPTCILATAANAGQPGGALLGTTAAAGPDTCVLDPYATSGFTGPFTPALLSQTVFDAVVRTVASIATMSIVAGLKLTTAAAGTVVATDANQALFVFDTDAIAGWNPGSTAPAASPNWLCVVSVAGADFFIDSGVLVQANKDYRLKILIRPDGVPQFSINNLPGKVTNAGAMTAASALRPVFGIANRAAATVNAAIRMNRIQRLIPS
jgi:hypothetical protein